MAGDSALTVKEFTLNGFKDFDTDTQTLLSDSAAYTVDMSGIDGGNVILYVNRPAGAKNPTIVVEDGGAYADGTMGNVTQLTTSGGQYFFGPYETSRFSDTAGKINITKSSNDTVKVYVQAWLVP